MQIDDTWYDLSAWWQQHPGGAHFIEHYRGRDATEVMHAFHSRGARRMCARLPRVAPELAEALRETLPEPSSTTRRFRELRTRLEEEGWWERDVWQECRWLLIWAALFFSGLRLAQLPGWRAIAALLPLTLATVQGAWLGHDYVHGVDKFSKKMRMFAPLSIGISPTWWSDKHNTHHALTNQMGADPDISMPPLFVWPPHPEDDHRLRKIQHNWFPIGCLIVFLVWRIKSVPFAWKAMRQRRQGARGELAALAIHWAIVVASVPLWLIPLFVALASLTCSCILMTSHLSDTLFEEFQNDWVTSQFLCTRGAVTRTAFTAWLWGGMQYHLEHHLFPSMPRSNYPRLSGVLKQFGKDTGIPGGYRADDEVEMFRRMWRRLRSVAGAPDGGRDAPRLRRRKELATAGAEAAGEAR